MSVVGGALGKFQYRGPISSSKSLYNRALVAQSFFPQLRLKASSKCDDVQKMLAAAVQLPKKLPMNCGDAGTVFRFMAFRAARDHGVFRLEGSKRLFERPQDDLLFALTQLSVRAEIFPTELIIESNGWKRPLMPLQINRHSSSQFATGLLMSAWNLDFPLEFHLHPAGMNDAYWNMSLAFAEQLGMNVIRKEKDHYLVPAGQQCRETQFVVEPDYSSAFAIAVAAAISGEAHLTDFGESSLQPDYAFINMLKDLRIPVSLEKGVLSVYRAGKVTPAHFILRDTPDLFPVLAVLCAFAHGESHLSGAPRLVYKESNRIKKTSELLTLMGVKNKITEDGIHISGKGDELKPSEFAFDPDQDHRMAMAAGVLMRAGWKIQLKTPDVVKKSFPEFWQILGIKP